jgi:hypothetical protein
LFVVLGHPELPSSLQGSGTDVTIQFHHILEKGSGIAVHTLYGPKHIAIHISAVSVGITYSLNCEGYTHADGQILKLSHGHFWGHNQGQTEGNVIGQTGVGTVKVLGINKIGTPHQIVLFKIGKSKHPKRW